MSIDKNDPRLTAYALGEMTPEETTAFEAELDAEGRAEIEAIRAMAERIPSRGGPIASLTPEQRIEVLQAKPRRHTWLVPAAAAAAVVAVFFLVSRGEPERQRRVIAGLQKQVAQLNGKFGSAQEELASAKRRVAEFERDGDRDTLIERNAQLRIESARAIQARNTAEAQNGDLNRRLASAETASSKDSALIKQLADQLKAQVVINRSYKDWLKDLTKGASAALIEKLNFETKWRHEVTNRVNLESQLKRSREEVSDLSVMQDELRKKLRDGSFWLNKYRQRFGDITKGPKGSPGVVKSVKGALVVLSVGSNDGVRVGDTYQIRRGRKHVGQVTVTTVYKDQSVGTFDTDFKGPGAPPQTNDTAEPRGY